MPTVNQNVQFKAGLQSNYELLEAKDLNTLYFCTDTQRMFVGETEYSRPVAYGTALPSGYMPANSLFYHTTEHQLYFSQDGASWQVVANFYTHPTFTSRVLGENTGGTLQYGGTFKVPSFTVDTNGHVTQGQDIEFTMPTAQDIPEVPDVEASVSGEGNVVTNIEASGHTVTVTKGFTAASQTDLDAVEATANAAMPKSGGTFTGPVTVQTPTEDGHASTKGYVDQEAAAAEQAAKEYADSILGANDAMVFKGTLGTGGTVEALPTTYETGWTYRVITAGSYAGQQCEVGDLIIAIANATDDGSNTDWTVAQTNIDGAVTHGAALTADEILLGDGAGQIKASGTALSDLATATQLEGKVDKTTTVNGHALDQNITLDKTDIGLGNVDNTADANKSVLSAAQLTTARDITIAGDATGTASFDGTSNVTITVDVARATADAEGNEISTTYATKTEVQNSTLKWGEF